MRPKQAHILIVDDDADLCKSLEIILKRQGLSVTTAEGGEAAIAAVEETNFSLILIDVVMPDMNGLEVLKALKTIAPDSRMVMMTGFVVADLIKNAIRLGVDGVLYKPFDVEVVARSLLSEDVVVVFEGYLQSVWDRILPIVGAISAGLVFERAFGHAFGEKSLSVHITITDQGIHFENIREHSHEMEAGELRNSLQRFLAEVFILLENLTGNILTDTIIKNISDDLKAKSDQL